LIGEYDPVSGNAMIEHVWLESMPVAAIKNGSIFYVYPDHLGTPRAITDTANQTVWYWNYDEPFGATEANENPNNLGAFSYNLRFPGQYFDSETGLHYNGHRDYNPEIGKYIQSDPIGLKGGQNTHAYVAGNSLIYGDPDGLARWDRWYGFNNREFQRWFHRCWKQPGNPDAGKEEMADAYAEWVRRGSPKGGKCDGPPPPPPPPPAPEGEVCDNSCKEKVATVVIVGGAAYVVYRCVRMIPSIVIPPLWPTIPINVVVP